MCLDLRKTVPASLLSLRRAQALSSSTRLAGTILRKSYVRMVADALISENFMNIF